MVRASTIIAVFCTLAAQGVAQRFKIVELPLGEARPLVERFENSSPVSDDQIGGLLDATWRAAERLPQDKRDRLAEDYAALRRDHDLCGWAMRAGYPDYCTAPPHAEPGEAYGKDAVRILQDDGIAVFLSRARTGAPPFNIGRPDLMGIAAVSASDADADAIFQAMFDLAAQDSGNVSFERPMMGHAAAEAAMRRCDAPTFAAAVQLTHAPDSPRYALWQGRIDGDLSGLAARIDAEAEMDDTRYVRQVMDGLRPIISHGMCPNG